jgi:Cytochrome c oxidase subunit IIa family
VPRTPPRICFCVTRAERPNAAGEDERGSPMTPPSAPPRTEKDAYQAPQGTLALLLVYLALIVVGWIGVYLTMLSRGIVR